MDTHLKLLSYASSELVDVTLYRQIFGSLTYLTNTQPDICFVVNTLSQYLVDPIHVHRVAAKHVMRYLKGTIDYCLNYTKGHDFRLYGYTDSYWEGSVSYINSTSEGYFSMGSTMISWLCKKQYNVSLNTAEAEYIVACSSSCESIWILNFLLDLFDLKMWMLL